MGWNDVESGGVDKKLLKWDMVHPWNELTKFVEGNRIVVDSNALNDVDCGVLREFVNKSLLVLLGVLVDEVLVCFGNEEWI